MTTGNFSSTEWKQLVNAPELIYHLLTATDRGTFFTKRSEAKALTDFMSSYQSQSALVQSIITGQKDADDKIEASPEEAQRMLEKVGALLEAKSDDTEGDAVRDFLMNAGEAIAKAAREQSQRGGKPVSAAEQKTLAAIASALKATEGDKRRRHDAAVAAEARRLAEEEEFKAKRQAETRKKTEEARLKREAEAQKQEEEARLQREAESKKMMDEARRQREAEAKKKAEEAAREAEEARLKSEAEAQKKAEEARLQREAEAQKMMEEARLQREAEAQKKAEEEKALLEAEAMKAKAETIYVVKPGDTLSGISKSVYGKASRWREIFEANKDIIENPNLIRPGWKLRIPD